MSKTMPGKQKRVRALIQTDTYSEADNTIDVVFVTDSPVEMCEDGVSFMEVLSCDPAHIRLERLQAGGPFLKDHKPGEVENQIGVVVSVWFIGSEGWAKIRLSERDDCAGVVSDIIKGILRNISVGYDVFNYENIGVDPRGLSIMRAIDWEPFEISITSIPADYRATTRSKTIIQLIKKLKTKNMTREEKIRSYAKRYGVEESVAETMIADGLTVEEALEKILDTVSGADDADDTGTDDDGSDDNSRSDDGGDDDGADDDDSTDDDSDKDEIGKRHKPVKKNSVSILAERKRTETIRLAVRTAGLKSSVALDLITRGTSETEAMKIIVNKMAANQKKTNARVSGRDESDTARSAMLEALLHRHRPADFKLTLPKAQEYRGSSLIDIAKEILEQKGITTKGMHKADVSVRALSTSDFPNLMSNVANKFLRKAYEEAPQTWRPLATQVNATDFKEIAGIQAGANFQLEEIQENGEYKLADFAESAEKFRVKTYGKIIRLSRQMLINDDLNAFANISKKAGDAGARLESDIMWGLFLNAVMSDGKNVYHADHKNLASSGTALGIDSLSAARVAIGRQTGLSGEQLNLIAKFLIVPLEKQTVAEQLMTGITSTEVGSVNPFTGKYNIITDGRIPATNAWYMSADPTMIDILNYAYLEGHEGVYVEQRESFNTDGIEIKVRHDFGGVMADYRGVYKNPGA